MTQTSDAPRTIGGYFRRHRAAYLVTAVCIAILADERKLSFDDPLAKHLPEFAGLMVIRAYHRDRGGDARDVVLIPASAHGRREILRPREPSVRRAGAPRQDAD